MALPSREEGLKGRRGVLGRWSDPGGAYGGQDSSPNWPTRSMGNQVKQQGQEGPQLGTETLRRRGGGAACVHCRHGREKPEAGRLSSLCPPNCPVQGSWTSEEKVMVDRGSGDSLKTLLG